MPTGPSGDSASPPAETDRSLGGSRRQSWLAARGWHPVTWAAVGLVLVVAFGIAVSVHEPGGRAQTRTAYCGLVTCAVLRSTAANSRVAAEAAHPAAAPSSPLASPSATTPAPTPSPARSPRTTGLSAGTPAPSPRPAPAATGGPGHAHWPWPSWWPPSGGWGPGWGHGRGYPGGHSRGFGSWPGGGR
jgi:hypothetical protein